MSVEVNGRRSAVNSPVPFFHGDAIVLTDREDVRQTVAVHFVDLRQVVRRWKWAKTARRQTCPAAS